MVGGAGGDLGLAEEYISLKGWGDELSIRVILPFAVPGVTANGRMTRMVGGAGGDLGLVSAKGWGDELSIRVILLFAVPGVTANGRIADGWRRRALIPGIVACFSKVEVYLYRWLHADGRFVPY